MVDKKSERELAEHLAPRIKDAIGSSGRTYESIADEIGVSKPAVGKWTKKGQISMSNLCQLAVATNKSMAWFFPGYEDVQAEKDADHLRGLAETTLAGGDAAVIEDLLLAILSARRDSKLR